MPTEPELLDAIVPIVAEVLGLDAEEVSPKQNFFHDLGGESIDVIDLQFRVDKQLGIRVQFQEMMSTDRWSLDEEGRFTAETRTFLAEKFPFLKAGLESECCRNPQDLFTVEQIANFVEWAARAKTTSNG